MINVKKSQKNKTLHLKNLKTLKTPHTNQIPTNPFHTRLRANTKSLQRQKNKKLNHNKSPKPYATLNPPNVVCECSLQEVLKCCGGVGKCCGCKSYATTPYNPPKS